MKEFKNLKDVAKLLEGSEESFVLATKNGVGIVGNGAEILSFISMIIRQVKDNFDEKSIQHAVALGLMSNEELVEKYLSVFLNKSDKE